MKYLLIALVLMAGCAGIYNNKTVTLYGQDGKIIRKWVGVDAMQFKGYVRIWENGRFIFVMGNVVLEVNP